MSAPDDRTPAASPAGVQPAASRPFLLDTLYRVAGLIDEANAEDEEPERGGATSAWEHHHG
jgi:hypothetical protein